MFILTLFFKFSLYWFAAQWKTSTLRRQNFGLFYVKFSAEFNELSVFYKSNRKWQKLAKTKVVRKSANKRRSEAKG